MTVTPTSLTVKGVVGTSPASQSVQVKNTGKGVLKWSTGTPTASWVSVSPKSGTNTSTIAVGFATSTLAAGSYQAQFAVKSSNGASSTVTVALSLAPKLKITCPGNLSASSSTGSAVPVSYSATASGGVAPVTITGSPASGSLFPVGTTAVSVTARSSDGQSASCGFSVTVTSSASSTAPPPATYGPQSTITCPAGAISVLPSTNVQTVVDSYPGGTTFCLQAGTFYLTSSITPKTGDVFIGRYGAILDGSKWSTTDATQAAFRSHNQDIDNVTIRNLVIRNMPQRGIHAYYWMSDGWLIENNEITATLVGVAVPNNTTVRNNRIHHNTNGGYLAYKSTSVVFDHNEISYNGGSQQKVAGGKSITFRNNFVHHNTSDGIWFDGECTNGLVEGNQVEDNGREGIFFEISSGAIVRNNASRRNKYSGIFISTTKNAQVYGNTVENNFVGIQYYLNCAAVGGGTIAYDLSNNTAYNNTIRVSTASGAFGTGMSYVSTCTATQVAPYLNGSKSLSFSGNRYYVPNLSAKYWVWGINGFRYWVEWQTLGQDAAGVVTQ